MVPEARSVDAEWPRCTWTGNHGLCASGAVRGFPLAQFGRDFGRSRGAHGGAPARVATLGRVRKQPAIRIADAAGSATLLSESREQLRVARSPLQAFRRLRLAL